MSHQFEIKDSGERRDFDTGAKRDIDHNKPRFDLIPMTVIRRVTENYLPGTFPRSNDNHIDDYVKSRILNLGFGWGETANDDCLIALTHVVFDIISQQEKDSPLRVENQVSGGLHLITPGTYRRLANHYGGGAQKYDPWNWAKGMPFSVFHASLMRHIFAVVDDMTDEDHWSAIFFNAACILHFTAIGRNDLDDITPRLHEWSGCGE